MTFSDKFTEDSKKAGEEKKKQVTLDIYALGCALEDLTSELRRVFK